jgi:hypothetical protein
MGGTVVYRSGLRKDSLKISHIERSGIPIDLLDAVTESNHIAAQDSVAELVGSLANSARYILSNNPLWSSKRATVSESRCTSICIVYCTWI